MPELHPVELPATVAYIWHWFVDLHNGRSLNGFGANPISWPDLQAYFALRQLRPVPSELNVIRSLDSVALQAMAPSQKNDEPKPEGPKLKPGKPHLRSKRKS